jgi:hypothetical protein
VILINVLAREPSCPPVCDVFAFPKLRNLYLVNVMPNFVKEHFREGEVLKERKAQKGPWPCSENVVNE